jgi:hypothetical protein
MAVMPMMAANPSEVAAARMRRLPTAPRRCMATEYEPRVMVPVALPAPAWAKGDVLTDGPASAAETARRMGPAGAEAEVDPVNVPHAMQNV